MTRILLRSGKSPFTPVVAESTLTQDVFNSNSGNYLFQHSIWKALLTPGTEIISNGTLSERVLPLAGDADRINAEFDSFVIPLANAFRPEFAERLKNVTALIKDLTIPVTVVGVGAQASVSMRLDEITQIDDTVKDFVGAVLDRSASIGVRGQFTSDYLVGLGFPADSVDIIGCPSLFLHGPDLRIEKRVSAITADSRLALNLTPEVAGIGAFATEQAARHPNLTYIGQDANDLRLLLWGIPFAHVDDQQAPVHMGHPLYQSDRYRLFLDTSTWYDFLAAQDFVYGTRFHGNVAALLARTPAMLLAHDSRTLELADYHRMPHRIVSEFTAPVRAEELYDGLDFAEFNTATPDRFERYTSFLERNRLAHIWADGEAEPTYEDQLAKAQLPPAVTTLTNPDCTEIAARLQWLRDGMTFDNEKHKQRYVPSFPHPPRTDAAVRARAREQATKVKLAGQEDRIDALEHRLHGLEKRTVTGFIGRVGRTVKRKLNHGQTRSALPPGKDD